MNYTFCVALFVLLLGYCTAQRYNIQYNSAQRHVPILKLNYDINPDGSYLYEYETGNGIAANERGYVKNAGNPNAETQVMQGGYKYVGDDGQQYSVQYTADEEGFRVQGAHLPTPPPIPDAILKSLQYNAAHPEEDEPQYRSSNFKYGK